MRILLLVGLIASIAYSVHGYDECPLKDGGIGVCAPIGECNDTKVKDMVQSYRTQSLQVRRVMRKYLNDRKCDFVDGKWKICCSDCVTPDGKSGIIKDIRECPHLDRMSKMEESRAFVMQSKIDSNTMNVCCGPQPNEEPSACDNVITTPPHPTSKCCGKDTSFRSDIIGGMTVNVEEYPWTVYLEYNTSIHCSGSLISNRYVVTAARCLSRNIPVGVRVGEYDTENTGKDCIELPDGTLQCTDGAESVLIDSYHPHPEDDIALLRLKSPVKYTAFVRPICLPSSDVPADANFIVAGWGKRRTGSYRIFKSSMQVSLIKSQRMPSYCEKSICGIGGGGRDACNIDSGSPLMLPVDSELPHYVLAGVLSRGPVACGIPGAPAVYVNVYSHLDWIHGIVGQ